jgi:hypothetical protein
MRPNPPFRVRRVVVEWLPEFISTGITTTVGLWAGGRWLGPEVYGHPNPTRSFFEFHREYSTRKGSLPPLLEAR